MSIVSLPNHNEQMIFILRLKTCTYDFIRIPDTEWYVGLTHITKRMWPKVVYYIIKRRNFGYYYKIWINENDKFVNADFRLVAKA